MNWEILDRLKKIKEDKQRIWREKSQRKKMSIRIDDLVKTMHRVGKVELPIPNLFSYTRMADYFDGLEKIDLADESHIAAIVWFLKNQDNIEIANWERKKIDEHINQLMTQIRWDELQDYVICIEEIFLAIKKKSIQSERQILEQVLEILQDRKKPGVS